MYSSFYNIEDTRVVLGVFTSVRFFTEKTGSYTGVDLEKKTKEFI